MKKFIHILDLSGMECPLPLLKTKLFLSKLQSGEHVKVVTSDPTSWEDFLAFTETSGNKLVESNKLEEQYIFEIKKK